MFAPRDIRGRFKGARRSRRRRKRAAAAEAAKQAQAKARAGKDRSSVPGPPTEPPRPAPVPSLHARLEAMGRDELKASLDAMGVEYDGRLATAKLLALFEAALNEEPAGGDSD